MGITTAPYSGLVCKLDAGVHVAGTQLHVHSLLSFLTYKMPVIIAPKLLEDEMNL